MGPIMMQVGGQAAVLDDEKLGKLTHDEPAGKRQVFSMFTENALECLSAMEKACANDDNELWLMATGQLSSLADVIGASTFAHTVTSVKDEQAPAPSDRKQMITKVRAEFERLRQYFRTVEKQ